VFDSRHERLGSPMVVVDDAGLPRMGAGDVLFSVCRLSTFPLAVAAVLPAKVSEGIQVSGLGRAASWEPCLRRESTLIWASVYKTPEVSCWLPLRQRSRHGCSKRKLPPQATPPGLSFEKSSQVLSW